MFRSILLVTATLLCGVWACNQPEAHKKNAQNHVVHSNTNPTNQPIASDASPTASSLGDAPIASAASTATGALSVSVSVSSSSGPSVITSAATSVPSVVTSVTAPIVASMHPTVAKTSGVSTAVSAPTATTPPVPSTSVIGSASVAPAPQNFFWTKSEGWAFGRAMKEKRPMIIDYTADWCTACKEMERTTFVDPSFLRAAARFVGLRVDGTDEDSKPFADHAKRFNIKNLPVVIVMDSSGKVANIFRYKLSASQLVPVLEATK